MDLSPLPAAERGLGGGWLGAAAVTAGGWAGGGSEILPGTVI